MHPLEWGSKVTAAVNVLLYKLRCCAEPPGPLRGCLCTSLHISERWHVTVQECAAFLVFGGNKPATLPDAPQKRSFNSSAKKNAVWTRSPFLSEEPTVAQRERSQDITDEDLCFLTKNSARNQQKVQLLRTFKMFNMSLSSSLLSSNVQERYEYGRNVCFQLTNFWSLKLYFCWFIFEVLMVPKVNKMYSKYLSGKVSVATLQYRALEKKKPQCHWILANILYIYNESQMHWFVTGL